jgi:histidine triad (HIT) family protein
LNILTGAKRSYGLQCARSAALSLARTRPVGIVIREVIKHMPFAIPLKRLRETDSLLAFHHPSPGYPIHILLLPKQGYKSLLDLPIDDSSFQCDLFSAVQSLVQEFDLEAHGYRLIANGGTYQEIPILHFHLVSGHEQEK